MPHILCPEPAWAEHRHRLFASALNPIINSRARRGDPMTTSRVHSYMNDGMIDGLERRK
jgi:hypothetical protein